MPECCGRHTGQGFRPLFPPTWWYYRNFTLVFGFGLRKRVLKWIFTYFSTNFACSHVSFVRGTFTVHHAHDCSVGSWVSGQGDEAAKFTPAGLKVQVFFNVYIPWKSTTIEKNGASFWMINPYKNHGGSKTKQ